MRTRLAKAKLSTSLYDVERAMAEYDFIKANFVPPGTRVDIDDCEGWILDDEPATKCQPPQPLHDVTNSLQIKLSLPSITLAVGRVIQGAGFRLSIPATHLPTIQEQEEIPELDVSAENGREASISDEEDNENQGRHTFCPPPYRDAIISMMEQQYCAHPSIPGSSPPEATLIKKWAVQRMYNFCIKHELPEVWAYFWENWYCIGCWELWARCAHKLIPVLKTTMILESQ